MNTEPHRMAAEVIMTQLPRAKKIRFYHRRNMQTTLKQKTMIIEVKAIEHASAIDYAAEVLHRGAAQSPKNKAVVWTAYDKAGCWIGNNLTIQL